jgi:DNA polymerase III subunit chi
MPQAAGQVWFYQVGDGALVPALAGLLEKCLSAGWRVAVVGGAGARLAELDAALWQEPDDGFLPHALATDPDAARFPILLCQADMPHHCDAVILLDGSPLQTGPQLQRNMVVFETSSAARTVAREQWKEASSQGMAVSYWIREESGKWTKKL